MDSETAREMLALQTVLKTEYADFKDEIFGLSGQEVFNRVDEIRFINLVAYEILHDFPATLEVLGDEPQIFADLVHSLITLAYGCDNTLTQLWEDFQQTEGYDPWPAEVIGNMFVDNYTTCLE